MQNAGPSQIGLSSTAVRSGLESGIVVTPKGWQSDALSRSVTTALSSKKCKGLLHARRGKCIVRACLDTRCGVLCFIFRRAENLQ